MVSLPPGSLVTYGLGTPSLVLGGAYLYGPFAFFFGLSISSLYDSRTLRIRQYEAQYTPLHVQYIAWAFSFLFVYTLRVGAEDQQSAKRVVGTIWFLSLMMSANAHLAGAKRCVNIHLVKASCWSPASPLSRCSMSNGIDLGWHDPELGYRPETLELETDTANLSSLSSFPSSSIRQLHLVYATSTSRQDHCLFLFLLIYTSRASVGGGHLVWAL